MEISIARQILNFIESSEAPERATPKEYGKGEPVARHKPGRAIAKKIAPVIIKFIKIGEEGNPYLPDENLDEVRKEIKSIVAAELPAVFSGIEPQSDRAKNLEKGIINSLFRQIGKFVWQELSFSPDRKKKAVAGIFKPKTAVMKDSSGREVQIPKYSNKANIVLNRLYEPVRDAVIDYTRGEFMSPEEQRIKSAEVDAAARDYIRRTDAEDARVMSDKEYSDFKARVTPPEPLDLETKMRRGIISLSDIDKMGIDELEDLLKYKNIGKLKLNYAQERIEKLKNKQAKDAAKNRSELGVEKVATTDNPMWSMSKEELTKIISDPNVPQSEKDLAKYIINTLHTQHHSLEKQSLADLYNESKSVKESYEDTIGIFARLVKRI